MNIKFKTIDIQNFRSIDKAVVTLQNQGTVLVKGINEYEDKATSNGSGKSSIFEAIIFCLFEETSSGEKDVANRINDNGYNLVLTFDIDGIEYKIQRQCINNKTSVILYKDNVDISARNKTDTNKLIISLLGITKNIFLDSVFLSQNVNTNLTSLSPTARKERLEILTNTDSTINNFKAKLKEKQLLYEADVVSTTTTINQLQGQINALDNQTNQLQFKLNEAQMELQKVQQLGTIEQIEQQIEQQNNLIKQNENKVEECNKSIILIDEEINTIRTEGKDNNDKQNDLQQQKMDKLNEYNIISSNISKIQQDINYNNIDINRIKKEIQQIQNSDKCPTCGRKLDNIDDEHIKNNIKSKQQEIDNLQQEIKQFEECINTSNNNLQNIQTEQQQIDTQLQEINLLVQQNNNLINDKQQRRRQIEQQKDDINNNSKFIQNTITELQNKKQIIIQAQTNNIKEYEDMLHNIEQEKQQYLTEIDKQQTILNDTNNLVLCAKDIIQLITKDFRTYLLKNSINYLNTLLVKYSQELFSNTSDVIVIEGNDTKLDIKLGNATYESLSGGEKTRVNIALLLAQKSLANMIGNISCNIIILDEILGYCDNEAETNVINLITQELDSLESIYMVSHKEIPIAYDTQLIVTKNKQGLSNVRIN